MDSICISNISSNNSINKSSNYRSSSSNSDNSNPSLPPQGAALGAMVGQMTFGKRQWEGLDHTMRRLIPPLHHAATSIIPAIDADTAAFNAYMVGPLLS